MNNDIEKELKEVQIQYDKVLKNRNELKKENKLLKKDLEILEILKHSLELKEYDGDLTFEYKFCFCKESLNDDYEIRTIKEWLESE